MQLKIVKNSIIITPNNRLANHLRQSLELNQATAVWETPLVVSLTTWLLNCWQEIDDPHIVLSEHQERALWQKIIVQQSGAELASLARKAQQAYELINDWQLEVNSWPSSVISEDIATFQTWLQEFKLQCNKNQWVVSSQLPKLLSDSLKNCPLILPKKIFFIGFEEFSSQLQLLIQTLADTQHVIEKIDLNDLTSIAQRISFQDVEAEITTIARWAQQQVKQNPNASVGCVVSNLQILRTDIQRIFSEVFADTETFNISLGLPLNKYKLINSTLKLLTLNEPVAMNDVTDLLLSPFLCIPETDYRTRAELDTTLKGLNQPTFYFNELTQITNHAKNISLFFNELQKGRAKKHQKQPLAQWVQQFTTELDTYGWLKDYALNAEELQIINRWHKLLNELPTLAIVHPQASRKECLRLLQVLAANTIFQPKINNHPQVNILGTLEAAGMNFDALWIMGMDQENWPTAPAPNPFLPITIQRKFNLPHATAERELAFCEHLTQRFLHSAPLVIFSHQQQIDEYTVNPSILIAAATPIAIDKLNLPAFTPATNYQPQQNLEILDDQFGPPLVTTATIHGGSKILELQSACPFRAFAEIRLNATTLPTPQYGISKKDRGIVIHAALDHLWQKIKDQDTLCRLSATELKTMIAAGIEPSLANLKLHPTLMAYERIYLQQLLWRFLQVEKERLPFKVTAREQSFTAQIGPLKLKLRLDRIDQLDSGSVIIIDYKTGKILPAYADWFGPRPKNVQLPLYCLSLDNLYAIAFGHINAEKVEFKIIDLHKIKQYLVAAEIIPPDEVVTWKTLSANWRSILENLANDFAHGAAQVDPVDRNACANCALAGLCRI